MQQSTRISAARGFARSFNILLKYARLYGFQHRQAAAQFDVAWNELRGAINMDSGLLLGVADGKLLLDGMPLESGPAERGFADFLQAAGISSLQFSHAVTPEDFERLIRTCSIGKPSELLRNLKLALHGREHAIRINELRFVADDGMSEGDLATRLTASALGADANELGAWLSDPHKLLQLLAAAEGVGASGTANGEAAGAGSGTASAAGTGTGPGTGSGAGAGSGTGTGTGSGAGAGLNAGVAGGTGHSSRGLFPGGSANAGPVREDDIIAGIRWLTTLGHLNTATGDAPDRSVVQQEFGKTSIDTQQLLRQVMASAAASMGEPDTPMLLKLAEHLAIRYAMERFERGEVRVNAVRELLERMSSEMETLQKVLRVHEDKMQRAGLMVESHADILDRQFWAAVPEKAKRAVLLSSDSWCIPPRNVRSYVEQVIHAGDLALAGDILRNYACAIESADQEARRKTSIGMAELADLYGRIPGSLLTAAVQRVGEQLAREATLDLQSLLAAAFVRLSHEASACRNYAAVEQSLATVVRVEQNRPTLAADVRPRIAVENRLREFIDEAVRAPELPAGLIDVLRRTPRAASEECAVQFARCTTRDTAQRVIAMVEALGAPALTHLRDMLRSRAAAQAIGTVGLLSRLDPDFLREDLASRLGSWTRTYQDAVVAQIACGGAADRGRLLLDLFGSFDPLILPQVLDEIGMSGCRSATGKVLSLLNAADRPVSLDAAARPSPYLRLKAVETLGRLHDPNAVPVLEDVIRAHSTFSWSHPRELRIAAGQALTNLDPDRARVCLAGSGLDAEDLQLAPLPPDNGQGWVRPRRYLRISPMRTMTVIANGSRGRSSLTLEQVSLAGGLGSADARVQLGPEATLEFQAGMRRLRSHVLVREVRPRQFSFEVLDIDLDDRSRLRRLLTQHLHLGAPAHARNMQVAAL